MRKVIAALSVILWGSVFALIVWADRQYGKTSTVTDAVYTVTFVDKADAPFGAMTLAVWNTDAAGGDTCYLDYNGGDHTDGTVEGSGSTSIVVIPANTVWDHEFNLPGVLVIYIDCTGDDDEVEVHIDANDSRR